MRSWLRSSRAVSVFGSIAFEPPDRKPDDQHALEAATSIFAWIGVSTGIS